MGRIWLPLLAIPLLVACDARTDNLASDDAGLVEFADADPLAPDAGPNAGCQPAGPACNNCVDDDGDGLIDGFDPECTGILDEREDSFATGIPGDNIDSVKQDCFFDGDSGAGNDGCDLHVCCLLAGDCPSEFDNPPYDPADCTPSDQCVANCRPLTPPGCDCFGCCTICNDEGCFDVLTNPAVAPGCQQETAGDSSLCPRCDKVSECEGGDCSQLECILCPGQTADDLPDSCDAPVCPGDLTRCSSNDDCVEGQFCAAGCCIDAID